MQYDFDQIIPRHNTGSFKWDRYKDTEILPFWVADMDFAVAPPILEAVSTRIQHPVFGYSNAPDELAPAICNHLGKYYQWDIQPEWLVWLPGVVPGLAASCHAVGSTGDEVVTFPPIYHHFLSVAQPAGKKLVTVALQQQNQRYEVDFDAVADNLNARSKLMLLCSPHNPVGKVFSTADLRKFCDLAARNNTVVISDEIHCDLVLDTATKHVPTALACPEYAHNIITLMSPSKTFNLAGMNCSFAVIQNPVLRKQFVKACNGIVPMVPTLSFEAALGAYQQGDEWHRQLLEYLRGNYNYLIDRIAQIDLLDVTSLEATYLAWINCQKLGLENPNEYFEQAGVGLSAGLEFGQEGAGYARMNFACPRSTLKQGLDRIEKAINSS